MATYNTPGVYVQEIPTLPASVAPVATAIPAFIGYTESADDNGLSLVNTPRRISSLMEYQTYFGGPAPETGITVTVDNGNVTVSPPATPSSYIMYYQMQLYFSNGGGPCYVVSVGGYDPSGTLPVGANVELTAGLDAVAVEDEPTLIVFPDAVGLANEADFYNLYEAALAQCNMLQDRFTIIDLYSDGLTSNAAATAMRTELVSDHLNYGAAYYPHLQTSLPYHIAEDQIDVVVVGGAPILLSELAATDDAAYNAAKAAIAQLSVTVPPSAAIAGVYARVDRDRGVWEAPANTPLANVIAPTVKVTDAMQETLNVDPVSGKSINAIRAFSGKGTLVWGARTLAGNDNEWRYIPTRRLFIMAEESIKKATSWSVFEANDARTWIKVKTQIENFLSGLWRDGALAGAKAEEAFFVNVGLGVTMNTQDVLEGRMNVEIGMAAVRPAEFVILKFSHKLQES